MKFQSVGMVPRLLKNLDDHAPLACQAKTAFFADLDDINWIDLHRNQPILPDIILYTSSQTPHFPAP